MLRRVVLDAARLATSRAVQQYAASTSYLLQPALPHQAWLQRSFVSATQVAWQGSFAAAPEFQANVWKAEPCSLEHGRPLAMPRDETVFKRVLLRIFGFYTRESTLIRGAKALHDAIQEQAENPALYEALGLEKRFANAHALLCLHVWMTLVRLREEGKNGKDLAQMLYENFQDNVEHRVHAEGVKVRISKWLKDLETMFYGSSLAYDKALQGNGELSEALLRNVYGGDQAKAPEARALARYVQRELSCLALTDKVYLFTGQIQFSGAALPGGALGWVKDSEQKGDGASEGAALDAAAPEAGRDPAPLGGAQRQYAG